MSADVLRAEERLIQAALRSLLAERRLADEDGNILTLADTSDALRVAAEDLTEAVKDLPWEKQPRRPKVEPAHVNSGAKDGV